MDCVYPCLHPSFILCPSIPSLPVSGPRGPLAVLCTPGPGFLWLLTTCCRQIVLSVLVHYCTFSFFSQHIKCIKDQSNSATNKDSTTADRVDGWSTAREKFDPLCIMFLCVSVCACTCRGQHTQSTKRGNKQHVTQSGTRQTCLMKLLFTEVFDLTLI